MTDDQVVKDQRSARYAAQIREHIPSGGALLEFGSGPGVVGSLLAPHFDRVVFADIDESVLSEVNGETWHWDGISDNDRAGSFGAIVAVLSLHHVTDLPTVLHNLKSLLEKGGYLAVVDLEPNKSFHAGRPDFKGHHGFDPEWLGQVVEKAGFHLQVIEPAALARQDGPAFFLLAQVAD